MSPTTSTDYTKQQFSPSSYTVKQGQFLSLSSSNSSLGLSHSAQPISVFSMYPSLQVLHILFHLVPYRYHCMHSFVYLSDERKQSCLLIGFPKDCIWTIQSSSSSALRTIGSSNLHICIQVTYQITTFTTRNSCYYLTLPAILDIPSHSKTSFPSDLRFNVQNSVQIPYKFLIWFWKCCPCEHTIKLLTQHLKPSSQVESSYFHIC